MSIVMAFDPSGNFKEGKGTTGYAISGRMDEITHVGEIKSTNSLRAESYWLAHTKFIDTVHPDHVVFEGYRIYNHAGQEAKKQANSEVETLQLIGVLKTHLFTREIPYSVQFASEVKTRWNDNVLIKKGILEEKNGFLYFKGKRTNAHMRDAIRHLMHHLQYGRNK